MFEFNQFTFNTVFTLASDQSCVFTARFTTLYLLHLKPCCVTISYMCLCVLTLWTVDISSLLILDRCQSQQSKSLTHPGWNDWNLDQEAPGTEIHPGGSSPPRANVIQLSVCIGSSGRFLHSQPVESADGFKWNLLFLHSFELRSCCERSAAPPTQISSVQKYSGAVLWRHFR